MESGSRLERKPTVYGSSYTDLDPVLEQHRRDRRCGREPKKVKSKEDEDSIYVRPSLNTRIALATPPIFEKGAKYIPPLTKKQRKIIEERHRQYEEELNFCKYQTLRMPTPVTSTKLKIKLKTPSAEIKETKIMPRKPSATPSQLYPEPPSRKQLELVKPKSGTFINQAVKKKRRVKKIRSKQTKQETEITIEEMIASELATIEEIAEGEEREDVMLQPPENYLTKQFRKKVAQLSKTTSITSKDLRSSEAEKALELEGEGEGEGEESSEEEDEQRLISVLTQKFRRDSEIARYQKVRRKIKKGTLENFSFTKLKQPTFKAFYYGVKLGTIHQGDLHFPDVSRGRQGICMPIAAFCTSILKHPDNWTQADVDDVLEAGNDLFLESAGTQHLHGDQIEIRIQDLQKYCKLGFKKIRFTVSEPEVSGMVRSDDKKIYNLTKGLNVFFGRYNAGILQTDTLNVAIWKDKNFYFFDAGPRTIDLFSAEDGVALMAAFYDTTSVVTVLLNRSNLENVPFIIYSITAYKVLDREAEEVDSTDRIGEMDNYQVLDEQKAVALGSFDLADKCFGFSRNKQALPIAVIALVYSKITPPSAWHKGTVDKITIIGNQLFLECIENDEIELVTIDDLPAVFTIGPYVVEVYIVPNRFVDFMFKKSKCMLLPRLEKFFETNSNAIVQIDSSTLAIWKQRDMYHCFDPYSRNTEGLKCRDGVACVSMHTNLNSLIQTVAANFDEKDMIFRVHAMKVCKINRDPNRKDLFPKNLTMNDYPIENLTKNKMRRGKRCATAKPVTVDHETRATMFKELLLEGSILQVGSNIKSIAMEDLPPMCHRTHSRPLPQMTPIDEDFVADLDSPSLSDTQIEPPPLEDTEAEVEFMDLDSFQLTVEEKELEKRGEGEDKGEGGEDEDEGDEGDEDEDKEDEEGSAEMESEALEAKMAAESAEAGGEEWYMASTDYTQVGSQSLLDYPSKMSQEVCTDGFIEIPDEEVPTARRNLAAIRARIPEYDIFVESPEMERTLSEELACETNFMDLPDGSQIVLGSMNLAQFGKNLEIMAPFVCIMATAVAKKYAIASWTKEIVNYALQCGAELHNQTSTRFDQNYKLEISRVSLGKTDFSIQVSYIFDSYIKPRILAMAICKMLFPRSPAGILVTPTYSCTIFYKNHLFYLYDCFGNNPVGLSTGPTNEGVACFMRFTSIDSLVARIIYNKRKREHEENIEYNRFVLSACHIKLLSKPEPPEDDEEEGESEEPQEGEDEPVEYQPPKKKEKEEKKPSKMGYRLVNNLYKIEGSKAIAVAKEISENLKEDYFICLCACLLLLDNPLAKWDERKIDEVLDQGKHIFSHAEDLDVVSKKFIKNIIIDDYIFDIVTNRIVFTTYQPKRTFKSGIQAMLSKKHEYFILQFPNRCYVISVEKLEEETKEQKYIYHIFDPSDPSGKASWTRYTNFSKLVKRIRTGLVRGGESYNFHCFEIMSITKAPKQVIISNRSKKYKMLKDKKQEMMCKPFHEDIHWLDVEPIPWSWKVNKTDRALWRNWYVDFPDDLYSLFGTISPLDQRFPEKMRRKQALGNLVVAIGMTQIYELANWTIPVMDAILVNGDIYFNECVKEIEDEDYEVAFEDMKKECKIFPYTFRVKFTPAIQGTIFLLRLKQFNLYKSLRYFFDDFERRFGIIACTRHNDTHKHVYAFGKLKESEYFFYDCDTLGPPMYIEPDSGVPYMLRTTTLNRLLHVMTLTLRGGDFFIFDVGLSELKSIM